MIISVPSNARSLVHLDSECLWYRNTQQIFLKQSLKNFCQITVACFSSFFWQLTCINLLNLEAFFLLMTPFMQKSEQSVPNVYVYWQKNHSVWFSSALLFFHRLLRFCMHEVWVPSNKGIFNTFSKVFFLSQSCFTGRF